jgi:hypothetical protein
MRGMVDFKSVKSHLDANNLYYYSVYPKPEKPMMVVIRHLPNNTAAEDIFDRLVSLGSPSYGSTTMNHTLFLITLPRTAKSQEIFRLNSLCNTAKRV